MLLCLIVQLYTYLPKFILFRSLPANWTGLCLHFNVTVKNPVNIPKSQQKKPRCTRKRRDKKYKKDKSPTMFSLAEGCGCVNFRSGRRARSLGDDSSSCRSSEIEQEVPKKLGKRVLNGECTIKALAPFFKFWRRDDVSMTKAERSKYEYIQC